MHAMMMNCIQSDRKKTNNICWLAVLHKDNSKRPESLTVLPIKQEIAVVEKAIKALDRERIIKGDEEGLELKQEDVLLVFIMGERVCSIQKRLNQKYKTEFNSSTGKQELLQVLANFIYKKIELLRRERFFWDSELVDALRYNNIKANQWEKSYLPVLLQYYENAERGSVLAKVKELAKQECKIFRMLQKKEVLWNNYFQKKFLIDNCKKE